METYPVCELFFHFRGIATEARAEGRAARASPLEKALSFETLLCVLQQFLEVVALLRAGDVMLPGRDEG